MKRTITQQEETAYRLCHHDFEGLSIDDAAVRMKITVASVKKLLTRVKHKAPQLFPILTTRQRAILSMYDERLNWKEIVELLGISEKVLEKDVAFLRKRGHLFTRKPDQYNPDMDGAVKTKF